MDETLRNIGENLDRLCTVTIRPQGNGQSVVWQLHAAAREQVGVPLTMYAAERLVQTLKPGGTVLITTGAGRDDYLPVGETDGPPGAAALGAMLSAALGVVPVFVTDGEYVENVAATALAAGLGIRDYDVARRVAGTCAVARMPSDETATTIADDYFRRFKPLAVIAVEKLGPNDVGVSHTSTGRPTSPTRARAEALFDLAATRGVLTVGVGDNGNEIGFGKIKEAVRQYKQYGAECQCPCGRGLATRVATDALVVAGTSNWGAEAIAAGVAALVRRPDLLHSGDVERRMLEECVRTGAADGALGRHTISVDGTPAVVQVALLELMRSAITIGLMPPRNRPF
jgi:hypothetical protein